MNWDTYLYMIVYKRSICIIGNGASRRGNDEDL